VNDTHPRETLFRRADWRAGMAMVLVAAGLAFSGLGGFGGLSGIIEKWKKADYSHGFLVVPFAAYLVWRFRKQLPEQVRWPSWAGLPLVMGALGLFYIETKLNVAMEWIQGACILVALLGIWLTFVLPERGPREHRPNPILVWLGRILPLLTTPFAFLQLVAPKVLVQALPGSKYTLALYILFFALVLGAAIAVRVYWASVKVVLPALGMLALALPLPDTIEGTLGLKLRQFATVVASYAFQMLGFPTHRPNNVSLVVNNIEMSVEAACSGLSMLLAFVALTAAMVILCPPSRSWGDRWVILLSAIPIAIFCNVLRIIVSGLVLIAGWKQAFDFIVHDFAGWLMMPLALGIIWAEFKLLDWLFTPVTYMSREEVAKAGFAEARAEIERAAAESKAMQEAVSARSGRHPVPTGERHPAAAFLPLTAAGTSHAATAAGGTFNQTPPPPPKPPEPEGTT
jgi:exosortase